MRNSLIPILKSRIEQKFGEPISHTYQCSALQEKILEETGEWLGLSTLKRLFGLVSNSHMPRLSTLNIMSRYLGYENYSEFELENGVEELVSEFTEIESIETENLKAGEIVSLRYNPDRRITMKYTGEGWFVIVSSYGSKLMKGDRLRVSQFVKNFQFFVSDVKRDGQSLGSYVGAKQGGIVSLKIR